MTLSCKCFTADGSFTVTRALRFTLVRDRYLPYGALQITLPAGTQTALPLRVQFTLNGTLLHDGFVRAARYAQEKGERMLTLSSRSYTAVLTGNQLVPGMYYNVTLSSLMTTYDLPHISYQAGESAVRYLYVKENTAMWDALTAFAYKLCGGYPYVRVPNLLCVSPQAGGDTVVLPENTVLSRGSGTDAANLISRIDMADLDGSYGSFTRSNPAAAARGITRVRQIAMDKQFLYDPDDALKFRIACSNRRLMQQSVKYIGYCGEDCEDDVRCGSLHARVSRVVITCDRGTLITEDTFCFDDFCNV